MKKGKTFICALLTGLLVPAMAFTPTAEARSFSDVPAGHWAQEVINEVSDKAIMVGMGTDIFSPNSTLTRAQYTAILCNLAPDKSNGTHCAQLSDVPSASWYAEAARWGVTNNIISEVNGRFDPEGLATRELMANMTFRYLSLYYSDALRNDYTSAGYADEAAINLNDQDAVNVLTNNGLLAGRGDNRFEPQGTLTRAEAAAMAVRLMDVAEANPVEDPSSWDLDGAPKWFLVGKPDNYTTDQWTQLISYWQDKEELAHTSEGYPVELPSYVKTEAEAKEEMQMYIDRLYEHMLADLEASEDWNLDGAPEWFLVGKPDNYTSEQWTQLISYWQGKEDTAYRNVGYPTALPDYIKTESAAKSYMQSYIDKLYTYMQQDLESAEDPSSWDLDGAPKWFLVGKPDNYSEEKWTQLIQYWQDKEELAHTSEGYPVELPSYVKTEAEAKEEMQRYIDRLYEHMLKDFEEIEEQKKLEAEFLSGTLTISDEEQRMVDLVNEARREAGLNELKLSPVLCKAAAIRAEEAATKAKGMTSQEIRDKGAAYFHSRPNGDPVTTVLNDVGMGKYISEEYGGTGDRLLVGCGENLTFRTYEKLFSVDDAFTSLWNSTGHRENMLDERYDFIGVAYCYLGTNSAWCQLFMTVY